MEIVQAVHDGGSPAVVPGPSAEVAVAGVELHGRVSARRDVAGLGRVGEVADGVPVAPAGVVGRHVGPNLLDVAILGDGGAVGRDGNLPVGLGGAVAGGDGLVLLGSNIAGHLNSRCQTARCMGE